MFDFLKKIRKAVVDEDVLNKAKDKAKVANNEAKEAVKDLKNAVHKPRKS